MWICPECGGDHESCDEAMMCCGGDFDADRCGGCGGEADWLYDGFCRDCAAGMYTDALGKELIESESVADFVSYHLGVRFAGANREEEAAPYWEDFKRRLTEERESGRKSGAADDIEEYCLHDISGWLDFMRNANGA